MERLKVRIFENTLERLQEMLDHFCEEEEVVDVDIKPVFYSEYRESKWYIAVVKYIEKDEATTNCDKKDYWG